MPVLPTLSAEWLRLAAASSTPLIVIVAVLHLLAFCWLVIWARSDQRRMLSDLDDFTRGLRHRSVLERGVDVSDQIDAFLADVKDVLETPGRDGERQALTDRFRILDERRRYLHAQRFETWYTVCRAMIEAYPMAGILGTVLAIGAALQLNMGQSGTRTVSAIVEYFGASIWSTFAGLLAAMVLMFFNSLVETRFRRLAENREQIRETISRTKRELAFSREGRAE